MALPPYTPAPIVVNVGDRIISPTLTVKQKALFKSLLHDYDEAGQPRVCIEVALQMFAADPTAADGYGPALSLEGFVTRPKKLGAANDTLVDADPAGPQFGEILAVRTYAPNENWQAVLDQFPQTVMLQGNFFEYLRDNVPLVIGDLIRKHIADADRFGRFA